MIKMVVLFIGLSLLPSAKKKKKSLEANLLRTIRMLVK